MRAQRGPIEAGYRRSNDPIALPQQAQGCRWGWQSKSRWSRWWYSRDPCRCEDCQLYGLLRILLVVRLLLQLPWGKYGGRFGHPALILSRGSGQKSLQANVSHIESGYREGNNIELRSLMWPIILTSSYEGCLHEAKGIAQLFIFDCVHVIFYSGLVVGLGLLFLIVLSLSLFRLVGRLLLSLEMIIEGGVYSLPKWIISKSEAQSAQQSVERICQSTNRVRMRTSCNTEQRSNPAVWNTTREQNRNRVSFGLCIHFIALWFSRIRQSYYRILQLRQVVEYFNGCYCAKLVNILLIWFVFRTQHRFPSVSGLPTSFLPLEVVYASAGGADPVQLAGHWRSGRPNCALCPY